MEVLFHLQDNKNIPVKRIFSIYFPLLLLTLSACSSTNQISKKNDDASSTDIIMRNTPSVPWERGRGYNFTKPAYYNYLTTKDHRVYYSIDRMPYGNGRAIFDSYIYRYNLLTEQYEYLDASLSSKAGILNFTFSPSPKKIAYTTIAHSDYCSEYSELNIINLLDLSKNLHNLTPYPENWHTRLTGKFKFINDNQIKSTTTLYSCNQPLTANKLKILEEAEWIYTIGFSWIKTK